MSSYLLSCSANGGRLVDVIDHGGIDLELQIRCCSLNRLRYSLGETPLFVHIRIAIGRNAITSILIELVHKRREYKCKMCANAPSLKTI